MSDCYVYILASKTVTLYVGATRDLARRMNEHRTKANPRSFSARYDVNRLVYVEVCRSWEEALLREREIKGWRRSKKIRLIVKHNPKWLDLSSEWELS